MGEEKLIIRAGWLIDGSGGPVLRNVQLTVQNGRIRSIHPTPAPDPDRERSIGQLVDLSECTLLPGLIDSHTHLAITSGASPDYQTGLNAAGDDPAGERIFQNLMQYTAVGVLAVRDGGDPGACALNFKRNPPQVPNCPVRMYVAGRARYRPGRYGHLIGRELPADQSLAEAVNREDAAADHVKIVNSGLNSLTHFGRQSKPQFDLDEMKAAVKAARHRGFKTMVHTNGKIPVEISVEAGCDSIEHGYFMGKENLQKMADKGITWVPTVFAMKALGHHPKDKVANPEVVRRNLDHQIEQIQIARDLKVPIALGTDSGSSGVKHGQSVVSEMGLFMQAGLTIEEVVQCASLNGAQLLGIQQIGLIKEQMPATLVAVHGDPCRLPGSLNCIKELFIEGKQIISSNNKQN